MGEGARCLKLHFESEPYHTRGRLKGLKDVDDFEAMRLDFRRAVHGRANELPGWQMTRYWLQVCIHELEVSAASRVGDLVAGLAKALDVIGPVADAALRIAKG